MTKEERGYVPKYIEKLKSEFEQKIKELQSRKKVKIFLFGSYSPTSKKNLRNLQSILHENGHEPFLMEDIDPDPTKHPTEKTVTCTDIADMNILVLEPELPTERKQRGEFLECILIFSRRKNALKTVIAIRQREEFTSMIDIILDLPVHKVIDFRSISDIIDHLKRQRTLEKFQFGKLIWEASK